MRGRWSALVLSCALLSIAAAPRGVAQDKQLDAQSVPGSGDGSTSGTQSANPDTNPDKHAKALRPEDGSDLATSRTTSARSQATAKTVSPYGSGPTSATGTALGPIAKAADAAKTILKAGAGTTRAVGAVRHGLDNLGRSEGMPGDYYDKSGVNPFNSSEPSLPGGQTAALMSGAGKVIGAIGDAAGLVDAVKKGNAANIVGRGGSLIGNAVPAAAGISSLACDVMTAIRCARNGDWMGAATYGSAVIGKAAAGFVGFAYDGASGFDMGVGVAGSIVSVGQPVSAKIVDSVVDTSNAGSSRPGVPSDALGAWIPIKVGQTESWATHNSYDIDSMQIIKPADVGKNSAKKVVARKPAAPPPKPAAPPPPAPQFRYNASDRYGPAYFFEIPPREPPPSYSGGSGGIAIQ